MPKEQPSSTPLTDAWLSLSEQVRALGVLNDDPEELRELEALEAKALEAKAYAALKASNEPLAWDPSV